MLIEYIGILEEPLFQCKPHVHPASWQAVYYLQGHGVLTVGTEEINFEPGDLIFQPAGIPHCERSEDGYRNIHMDLALEHFPYSEPIKVQDTIDRDLYHIMMMCYNNYYRGLPGNHPLAHALVELLVQYTTMLGSVPERNEYVRQMEHMMIEGFPHADFSLKDMYHSIHISEDYARTLFEREMRCTPGSYLRKLRLRYACDQFRRYGKRISVQEVAARAGFGDVYYFSRLFKTHMGLCPREWVRDNCETPGSYSLKEEKKTDPEA